MFAASTSTGPVSALSREAAVLEAQAALSSWASGLSAPDVPASVRERFGLVLAGALGVGATGGRLPERVALVDAWALGDGPALVLGTERETTVEAAAWLNGTALVSLELDEGNKYAGGHPAAHGFPAVLALAAERDCDGATLEAALLVAYEVAARFGRATTLRSGMHPHGNWGVAGAAAGCARILGLSAEQMCAAIDTAAGMPIAGPFRAALDGNPVRNEWMGASNAAGIAAARLAQSGIARATGIAATSLGQMLGKFDPEPLGEQLGTRWDAELGYFKRHSSCAFTHPAADAALALRGRLDPRDVVAVDVETFASAAALDRGEWDNRLAAMFSVPFVIASALSCGEVRPARFGETELHDAERARLAAGVTVRATPEFDDRLPDHRGARVTATLSDGSQVSEEVRDPIGDATFEPFDHSTLLALLGELLGDDHARTVWEVARSLPGSRSAHDALARLKSLAAGQEELAAR